jgi:competence protein ComGC
MLCQGDAMKKDISLKLTVMTIVLLVVAVIVASIIPNRKKM